MNPILVGVAVAVIAGAIVTVSVRDARTMILGLAVVLVASPLLADPLASPLGLAARLVGSILGAYLLWIVVRDRPTEGSVVTPTDGSRIGWPAETLVAAAAALVGVAAHGLGAPAVGAVAASGAGFAVAALAVLPTLTSRDVLRMGVGSTLLVEAALLVRTGLGGTPEAMEQLLTAGLVVAMCAVVAAVAFAARLDGVDGYAFATEGRPRARREPDAHRIEPS